MLPQLQHDHRQANAPPPWPQRPQRPLPGRGTGPALPSPILPGNNDRAQQEGVSSEGVFLCVSGPRPQLRLRVGIAVRGVE